MRTRRGRHGCRTRPIRSWLLFVTLGFCVAAAADPPLDWNRIEAGYIPSAEQMRDYMAFLDAKLEEIKPTIANLAARFPLVTDARGRSARDDWRDYVLNEASRAEIAAQHQRMTQAIENYRWREAIAALNDVRFDLLREAQTMKAIADYWQQIGDHPPDFEPYLRMLQANSITPHYQKNLDSLERTFQWQIEHGLFAAAMITTLPKMRVLRARAIHLDSKALEALGDLPVEKRLYLVAGTSACAPEALVSSGSEAAKVDPTRPAAALAYPADSRRLQEEGSVAVGLVISATGCATRASVYGSSGYERLDRAAVEHALGIRFLPAEHAGQRVTKVSVLPVNFVLNHANAPQPQ
jgi:TonB family protein